MARLGRGVPIQPVVRRAAVVPAAAAFTGTATLSGSGTLGAAGAPSVYAPDLASQVSRTNLVLDPDTTSTDADLWAYNANNVSIVDGWLRLYNTFSNLDDGLTLGPLQSPGDPLIVVDGEPFYTQVDIRNPNSSSDLLVRLRVETFSVGNLEDALFEATEVVPADGTVTVVLYGQTPGTTNAILPSLLVTDTGGVELLSDVPVDVTRWLVTVQDMASGAGYFSGASTDIPTHTYDWVGTPNASHSLDSFHLIHFLGYGELGAVQGDEDVFLTGSGSLTTTGTLAVTGATATLSGAGTLAAVGAPSPLGTATLSGSGTLGAVGEIGSQDEVGTATLSGSGALTSTATLTAEGTATLDGSGSLTTAAEIAVAGVAALTGSGSLSSAAVPSLPSDATLSGSGTLTATGVPGPAVAAALSGSGTLGATGAPAASSAAALTGSGSLEAAGSAAEVGAGDATLSGSGDLTTTATLATVGTAALSGSGTLGAATLPGPVEAATLTGSGTLSAVGAPAVTGAAATLSGSGALTTTAVVTAVRSAALSGSGELTAKSGIEFWGIGLGASSAGSGTNVIADWLARAVDESIHDFTIGLFANKPYSATPASTVGTDITEYTVASGTDASGISVGSVRATGIRHPFPTSSAGAVTFTSSGVAIGQGARFSSHTGIWSHFSTTMIDAVETGTTVSATGAVAVDAIHQQDWLIVNVAIKDDAPLHSSQVVTVEGCTLSAAVTWGDYSTNAGHDLRQYVGIFEVLSGNSTGVISYAATSTVSGAAATAIGVTRLRSVPLAAEAVNFTGGGTLAAIGTIPAALTGTATLTGSGALTATGLPGLASAPTLAGSGSLTVTTALAVVTLATLAGSGTLTATTVPASGAAGTLQGSGTLTTTTVPGIGGTATLGGSGTLVAVVFRDILLTGTLARAHAGTLTLPRARTGTLTGTHTSTLTRPTTGTLEQT